MSSTLHTISSGLYVIMGDEPLLVLEALDHLRSSARSAGYLDREVIHADARTDWSSIQGSLQSFSLFGDKKLVELKLATGKPGKTGGEALTQLAPLQATNKDSLLIIQLPKLDKATRNSQWFKSLTQHAVIQEVATIERSQLPRWIAQRLKNQGQQTDPDTLQWIAERVEGNLLAAHQEILKLSLLFPAGTLAALDVQQAITNVARYDVFELRDAMLAGDSLRLIRMLKGLEAEGESPVLVLWSIGESIRALSSMAKLKAQSQPYQHLFRSYRFFGASERLANHALQRINLAQWSDAVQHAHTIDKIIKGLSSPKHIPNAWFELLQLGLSICQSCRSR